MAKPVSKKSSKEDAGKRSLRDSGAKPAPALSSSPAAKAKPVSTKPAVVGSTPKQAKPAEKLTKAADKPAKNPEKPAKTGELAAKPVEPAPKPAEPAKPIEKPHKTARPAPTAAEKAEKPASSESAHRHARTAKASSDYVPPPLEAVPTDGKPRKNQAGLGSRELEHFRDLLLSKRRELVGDMGSMEEEALRSSGESNLSTLPIHMADMGTDNYEQEFTLGLVEKERVLLREINSALAKIQNGAYGICEGTGKPIGKPRLEAQPWARFSIEYARSRERGRY